MTPELLLAQLQRVSLADLHQVLRQGGAPDYARLASPRKQNISIDSQVADVQAAARAVGFPLHAPQPGVKVGVLQIVKPAGGSGPQKDGLSFRVPLRGMRPLLQLAQAPGNLLDSPHLQDVAALLIQLAQWLRDNQIGHLTVTAPTAYIVRSPRDADPGAGPLAGDMIYLLGILPDIMPAVPTSAITSPITGTITAIGAGGVQIQGDENYAGALSLLVSRVHELRQAAARAEAARAQAYQKAKSAGPKTHDVCLQRLAAAEKQLKAAQQALKAAVPALSAEAERGYPSLSPAASIADITKACQLLYGRPGGRVLLVCRQLVPFRSLWVPQQPENAARLAHIQARLAEIERDQATREQLLRKLSAHDPDVLAATMDERTRILAQIKKERTEHREGPGSFTLGEIAGLQQSQIKARPTPHPSGASEAELAVLGRVARVQAEIREATDERAALEAERSTIGSIRLEFAGSVFVEVLVSTRLPSGRVLAPLPALHVGAKVKQGQALTETQTVQAAPPVAAPARPRRAIPLALRLDSNTLVRIGRLLHPDPAKPCISKLPVAYAALQPGQIGVIQVPDLGEVYATLASDTLVPFDEALRQAGGFGNFLQLYGFLSSRQVAMLPAATREAKALSPAQKKQVVAQVLGEKDQALIAWVADGKGMTLLDLSATPPSHVLTREVQAADVKIAQTLSDIEQITMYEFWQERPVESAPIKTRETKLLGGGRSLSDALAVIMNRLTELNQLKYRLMDAAQHGTKEQKAALILPEDAEAAAARAASFGTSQRDVAYVEQRLIRAALIRELSKFPQALAKVQAEHGGKSAAIVQIVAALKQADPKKYGFASPEEITGMFVPDSAAVQNEISVMREKMSAPRLISGSPMQDVLLVADLKPDAHGNKRASIELIPDLEHMELRRGQSGAQLGRLIQAFRQAPLIGYVPDRYPIGKQERDARQAYTAARHLSSSVAEAAARMGASYVPRGQFGVQKVGLSGSGKSATLLSPEFAVAAGRGGTPAAPSFGTLSSTAPQARRQMMLARLDPASADVQTPMGRAAKGLEIMHGKYREALADVSPELRQLTATRAELQSRARADKNQLEEVMSLARFKFNPRKRRNPGSSDILDDLLIVPSEVRAVLTQARAGLEAAGKGTRLTAIQEGAVKYIGAICATASVILQKLSPAQRTMPGIIKAVAEQVYTRSFLQDVRRVIADGREMKVDLEDGSVQIDRTAASLIEEATLAGPFYRIDLFGRITLRTSRTIATIFSLSPLLGVWVEAVGAPPPDLLRALQEAVGPIGSATLQHTEDTVQEVSRRPPARVVVLQDGMRILAAGEFLLTPESQDLLPGFRQRVIIPEDVNALRTETEKAYKEFLAATAEKHSDPQRLQGLATSYESALHRLQAKLAEAGSEPDLGYATQLDTRLTHFLAGRVAPGEDRPTQERRMLALSGSAARGEKPKPGPVGSYLDFYGRPLFPVRPELLSALGVRPIDYGNGQTLASRLTLSGARALVHATGGKAQISTSTLDARPGIGRGIREFSRPYSGYRPASWVPQGILNVTWLSPDGKVVRLYRAGAMVAMLKRTPGESLLEFLQEAAENWGLWLTDPQHKRSQRQEAQVIWLGQSGDPGALLYRINTAGDRIPLGRNVLARRMNAAGVQAKGDKLVLTSKHGSPSYEQAVKQGLIRSWGTPEEVAADAEFYLQALQSAGLATDEAARAEFQRLLALSGAPAQEEHKQEHEASLLAIFAPTGIPRGNEWVATGGTGTVPTGIDSTVYSFILGNKAFTHVRLLDQSFRLAARRAGTLAAADKLSPRDLAIAQTRILPRSPVAEILVDATAGEADPQTRLTVLAGAPSKDLVQAEQEISRITSNAIQFSPAVRTIPEDVTTRLLDEALKTRGPILVVETQDVPQDSTEANKKSSGLALLVDVYTRLEAQDRILQTPVVYTYPEIRGESAVQQVVHSIRTLLAKKLSVPPTQIPLTAISFGLLHHAGPAALGVVRTNPRHLPGSTKKRIRG